MCVCDQKSAGGACARAGMGLHELGDAALHAHVHALQLVIYNLVAWSYPHGRAIGQTVTKSS